jgi:integrase
VEAASNYSSHGRASSGQRCINLVISIGYQLQVAQSALYLGLRASEIVHIHRRDVDDGGRLLWIPDSKTDAGRRTLEVPEVLRPLLVKRAAECSGRLFDHDRSWVLQNVKRLCRLAGVPEISAHGLRGMHATLATRAGSTAHEVARGLSATPARP